MAIEVQKFRVGLEERASPLKLRVIVLMIFLVGEDLGSIRDQLLIIDDVKSLSLVGSVIE